MRSGGLPFVAYGVLAASLTLVCWLPRFGVTAAAYLGGVGVAAIAFLSLMWGARNAARPSDPDGTTSSCSAASPLFRPTGMLVAALGLRLLVVGAQPYLSDDVYRYLWEGTVQRAGHSPYVLAPDAPELMSIRDEHHARVNHPEVPAAYPPGIQLMFRLLPSSLLTWKGMLVLADLALLALLMRFLRRCGRPLAHAGWYAYHPLVVIEFAGTGHLDLLAMLAITAAVIWIHRTWWVAVLAALGGLIKPPGLAAAAGLLRERRWLPLGLTAVLVLLAFLPFAGDGEALTRGVREYERHWEFNGLLHAPLRAALQSGKAGLEALPAEQGWTTPFREAGYWLQPNLHARRLASLLFLGISAWLLFAGRRAPRWTVTGLLLAYLVCSPTVFPWYVAWLVPLMLLTPSTAIATLTLTALVSGTVKVVEMQTGTWAEPGWMRCAHWLPPCFVGVWELWRARRR